MCGRYTLAADLDDLIEVFQVPPVAFVHAPRYNVAPTQPAPVVASDRHGRRMGLMRWGLIPFWAEDPSIGNRQINARSESAHQRPAFREAFARRRCLVPADGFYEWTGKGSARRPYWIHPSDGGVLALAGLWDRWRPPEGEPVHSFTILTRPADEQVTPLHDRMPVILAPGAWSAWLDRDRAPDLVRDVLTSASPPGLTAREVSTWVNRPDHDDATCIEPLDG